MNLEQLTGRYRRLKQELSVAFNAQPWQSGLIDRLTNDLATTERDIAALHSSDRSTTSTRLIAPELLAGAIASSIGFVSGPSESFR
jgi:hypothetical protein